MLSMRNYRTIKIATSTANVKSLFFLVRKKNALKQPEPISKAAFPDISDLSSKS